MRHKEGNQLQSDYRHLSLVKVTSLFPLLQKQNKVSIFCNIYRQQERNTPNNIVIYAKQTPTSAVKVSGLVRVISVLAQSTSVSFLSHLLTSWTGPPDPIFVIHPYASTLPTTSYITFQMSKFHLNFFSSTVSTSCCSFSFRF